MRCKECGQKVKKVNAIDGTIWLGSLGDMNVILKPTKSVLDYEVIIFHDKNEQFIDFLSNWMLIGDKRTYTHIDRGDKRELRINLWGHTAADEPDKHLSYYEGSATLL